MDESLILNAKGVVLCVPISSILTMWENFNYFCTFFHGAMVKKTLWQNNDVKAYVNQNRVYQFCELFNHKYKICCLIF